MTTTLTVSSLFAFEVVNYFVGKISSLRTFRPFVKQSTWFTFTRWILSQKSIPTFMYFTKKGSIDTQTQDIMCEAQCDGMFHINQV